MRFKWIWIGWLIALFLLGAMCWLGHGQSKDTRIYEIPGTDEYLPHKSFDRRFFAVSNPPDSLDDLKVLVEAYVTKYLAENDYDDERKSMINWCFLPETSEINEEWVEGGGYYHTDYMEWHLDEAIAFVYCVEGKLIYTIGDTQERRYWMEGSDYSSEEVWDIVHKIEEAAGMRPLSPSTAD